MHCVYRTKKHEMSQIQNTGIFNKTKSSADAVIIGGKSQAKHREYILQLYIDKRKCLKQQNHSFIISNDFPCSCHDLQKLNKKKT